MSSSNYFSFHRDSTGSSGSHSAQTRRIPQTLKVSSESDSLSDASPFRHPGARGSVTQPPCQPTLIYGSESDDGSPIKRPRHPAARVSDKGPSCEPTLLYGSESDESPKKKPGPPMVLNEPTLLYESNSDEDNDKAAKRLKESPADVVEKDKADSLLEERPNTEEEMVAVKDTDATLPYYRAEMSSTDDEGDSGM